MMGYGGMTRQEAPSVRTSFTQVSGIRGLGSPRPFGIRRLFFDAARRSQLGQASSNVGVVAAQAYYSYIIPLLTTYCQTQVQDPTKCQIFQTQLATCQSKLSDAIAKIDAGDLTGLVIAADAAYCFKKLYEDVKDAFEPATPPPPQITQIVMPPQPASSIPWYIWALGATALVGAGVAIVVAVRK